MTDKKYVPTIAERIAKESRDLRKLEQNLRKESEALRKGKSIAPTISKKSISPSGEPFFDREA